MEKKRAIELYEMQVIDLIQTSEFGNFVIEKRGSFDVNEPKKIRLIDIHSFKASCFTILKKA